MPRLPVDGKKVQEFRITLGTKERQMVQDAQWSYTFGSVTKSIGGVISNPVVLLGLAGYLAYKLDQILDPDWRAIVADMTPDQVHDWLETQNLVGAGVGGIIGGILGLGVGNPFFGAALGSFVGSAAVEVGEAGVEATGEALDSALSPQQTIGIVSLLISIHRGLQDMGEALQPDFIGGNGDGVD